MSNPNPNPTNAPVAKNAPKAKSKAVAKQPEIVATGLITDAKVLQSKISAWAVRYQSSGKEAHVLFVSALWHVASSGNPIMLNRVFNVLRENDKNAARLFIRRAHIIVGLNGADPKGLPSEVIQAAAERGSIVSYKEGEFKTIKGHTSEEAKLMVDLCTGRLITPDGEADKFLLDRNNITESREIGDTQLLDQVIAMAKRLDSKSDNVKVTASDPIKKFIKSISDKAQVYKDQLSLGTMN